VAPSGEEADDERLAVVAQFCCIDGLTVDVLKIHRGNLRECRCPQSQEQSSQSEELFHSITDLLRHKGTEFFINTCGVALKTSIFVPHSFII
jgi:hypothetical protein